MKKLFSSINKVKIFSSLSLLTFSFSLITIQNVFAANNTLPVAMNDTYAVVANGMLIISVPGVLGNDSDVDQDQLKVNIGSISALAKGSGTITLGEDGLLSYKPHNGFIGSDTFTYTVNDGTADSTPATVTLNVINHPNNIAPTAVDDTYSVGMNGILDVFAPGLAENDLDPDFISPLIINDFWFSQPTHGTLTHTGNGTFAYVPTPGFSGVDTFTYKNTDGTHESNVATVTINVHATNAVPVAVGENYVVSLNGTLNISAPGLLKNDTDLDGDALSVHTSMVVLPMHGKFTSFQRDGSFIYKPNAGYFGPDSFQYKNEDGTVMGSLATVNINVTQVDTAPVSADQTYNVAANGVLHETAPGLLKNAIDVDGEILTLNTIPVVLPTNGVLSNMNSDGSFTYIPNAGYVGTDSFQYSLLDGIFSSNPSTVHITVLSLNNKPVSGDDNFNMTMNGVLNIPAPGVLINDTDADGDALNIDLLSISQPTHGTLILNSNGSFIYTPTVGFTGMDSFSYKANDGKASSLNPAKANITINPVVQAIPPIPQIVNNNIGLTSGGGSGGSGCLSCGSLANTNYFGAGSNTNVISSTCGDYKDIQKNDPMCVEYEVGKKLGFTGYADGSGTFGPNEKFTRSEAQKIVQVSFKQNYVEGTDYCNKINPFVDVVTGKHWAAQRLCWAKQNNKVTGYLDAAHKNQFLPESTVTNAEFATMLLRNTREADALNKTYSSNVSKNKPWYSGYWGFVLNNNLSKSSNPNQILTRAEALDMLYKFHQQKLLPTVS